MNIARYVKVGLFFITLGIGGTGYVILSTDGFNVLNTKMYEVVMDDATGLSTNSKVYLAGVPVGKIKAIDLTGERALLRVAFLRDVEIRGDARVARKSSSILGTSILALSPGSETAEILKEGGRIEPVPGSGDMSALMGSAQDLSVQLTVLIKELQENQLALLQVSIETFNSIAKKLDERSEAELERISRILESTALITERFDRMLSERETDITTSAADIRIAIENLRLVTEEIQAGRGTVGKALYDDSLYANLNDTASQAEIAALKLQEALDSINRLAVSSETVVKDAGSIVSQASGLGVQVDSRGRYEMLASRFHGGASLRLEPRTKDRWYRVGVTDTSFDAEIARRIGLFTLKGGLIEGSAGGGLEFEPFNWVNISGEVFDFNSGTLPNVRGTVTIYPFFDPHSNKPWNWLYLGGGVTAALGPNRDYFFGAGLRFADDEVRGLVGLVPAVVK